MNNAFSALQLVGRLREEVGVFKVGLELLMSAGIGVLDKLREAGAQRIFLDAKLHDIPNTVAGAMRGAVRAGAWCVTVHASGGLAMLRAASETARSEADAAECERPLVLAVTLLTSIDAQALREEISASLPVPGYVAHLARLARAAGCDGVIASPHEIGTIRQAVPDAGFLVVTPGVRPAGEDGGDQARVATPADAIRRGASHIVVGRPIVAAADPVAAARSIVGEIAAIGE